MMPIGEQIEWLTELASLTTDPVIEAEILEQVELLEMLFSIDITIQP